MESPDAFELVSADAPARAEARLGVPALVPRRA
jgi:hypothetical protein